MWITWILTLGSKVALDNDNDAIDGATGASLFLDDTTIGALDGEGLDGDLIVLQGGGVDVSTRGLR